MKNSNDRVIEITTASKVKSTSWKCKKMEYGAFKDLFRNCYRSSETLKEFRAMSKAEQSNLKDVGGFVAGHLEGNRRTKNAVKTRELITLDMDNIEKDKTEEVIEKCKALNLEGFIYSTRKHTSTNPRLRLVLLLKEPVSAEKYEPIARKVASKVGIDYMDCTTYQAERAMYFASACKDGEYIFEELEGEELDAERMLEEEFNDWRDCTEWSTSESEVIQTRRNVEKQEDPTLKRGCVGDFCRAYSIDEAIEKFLSDKYIMSEKENRYTYIDGSTEAGAVTYGDGKWLYSNHSTDPVSGQLVNAYDLVRIHKFSHLDVNSKEDTPVSKLPSSVKMRELIQNDEKIIKNVVKVESAKSENSENEETNDDWKLELELDDKNRIKNTIKNAVLILENCADYKGKIFFDTFLEKMVIKSNMHNSKKTQKDFRNFEEVDYNYIKMYLEQFNIQSDQKVQSALSIVSDSNKRNTVLEEIEKEVWDGVPRVRTLLTDYLGVKDSTYTREVIEKAMFAMIARATSEEAIKHDEMIILVGEQGSGKSTFLRYLTMQDSLFCDTIKRFDTKEALEQMRGKWLVEVGEMEALDKSSSNSAKSFLSAVVDVYRVPYERYASNFIRRGVFFGSTNNVECLRDITGNRRYRPVICDEVERKKDIFKDLKNEVHQIWAEAYEMYKEEIKYKSIEDMLVLSDEAEETAKEMQELCREVDPVQGVIREYLEIEVPETWFELSNEERRMYIRDKATREAYENKVKRTKTCVLEIQEVCLKTMYTEVKAPGNRKLGNILANLDNWHRAGNTRCGNFGVQKTFERYIKVQKTETFEDLI